MFVVGAIFLIVGVHAPAREGAARGRAGRARRLGAPREATRRARVRGVAPARAGRRARAPAGRATPGGSSASTEPPKPPPTIRAPAAPAALQPLDGGLDLRDGRLVVVAQRGVRGVEQLADALRGRAPRAPRAVASTRAFSLTTWRARLSSVPSSAARSSRVAQRGDAERLAGGAALGAALVVARAGERVGGAGLDGHERPVAEVERERLDLERAEVDPQHVARRATSGSRTGPAGRSRRRPSRSPPASRAWPAPCRSSGAPARAGRAPSAASSAARGAQAAALRAGRR